MSVGQDFKQQLKRQLGFLERSARDFDAGHRDEAIRIATVLRVIFHDTGSSTSLLKQLNAVTVSIRSKAPDRAAQSAKLGGRRIVGEFSWSLASIAASPSGGSFQPALEISHKDRSISAQDWWLEVFAHIEGVDYTRRAVVLWAANKDGGAHVDPTLPLDYERLKAAGAVGSLEFAHGVSVDVEDAHLVFLRTMAFEVLNSPDLQALA
jgi:hypothetical protein